MADTTKASERAAEQGFRQAEDALGGMFENGRRTLQTMMEYNRNSIATALQFTRDMQDESIRFTDAWFEQMTKFQKNTLKSFHDYSHKVQDFTEKTVKENQSRMEDTVGQGLEMVTPVTGRAGRR